MIDKLTPEQEALLEVYEREYTELGLSTEPLDGKRLKVALDGLYQLLDGKPAPKRIIVAEGPQAAWEAVCDHVKEKLSWISPGYVGNYDAGFLAWADYHRDVLGIKDDEYELYRHARDAHLVFPLEDVAIVSQRPTALHWDYDNDCLSCEDGPALEYADGTKLYEIGGITVPEHVILNPQSQTVEEIEGETNMDVKLLRIERFGWLNYLERTGAVVLDERENIVEGTYEVLFRTSLGNRFVPTCATGRIPVLGVPPEITTCDAAQRWLDVRGTRCVGRT